jgi:hypothetical protein
MHSLLSIKWIPYDTVRVFVVNRVKFNPIDTLYHGLYQVYLKEILFGWYSDLAWGIRFGQFL